MVNESMFPQSVAVNSFIPVFRRLIVHELKKKGIPQTEIARMLGITQAAVSKILKSSYSDNNIELRGLDISPTEIKLIAGKVAELLYEKNINEAGILANRYWWLIAASGDACRAHERYGWRKSECYICTKIVYPTLDISRGLTLADLERALLVLSASKTFYRLIPEVMSNIAAALPGAKSIFDVAAVPGRISKTKSGEIIYRRPEFGASTHLAGILLSVKHRFRAVMNIKYDGYVKRILEDLGVRYETFSSNDFSTRNPAAAAAYHFVEECPGCRVLIDLGGRGVEPVTYVFGDRAIEIAEFVAELAEIYDALLR